MADVIDCGVAHQLDHASYFVDLDFADVAAVREGALTAIERAVLDQARLHALGNFRRRK